MCFPRIKIILARCDSIFILCCAEGTFVGDVGDVTVRSRGSDGKRARQVAWSSSCYCPWGSGSRRQWRSHVLIGSSSGEGAWPSSQVAVCVSYRSPVVSAGVCPGHTGQAAVPGKWLPALCLWPLGTVYSANASNKYLVLKATCVGSVVCNRESLTSLHASGSSWLSHVDTVYSSAAWTSVCHTGWWWWLTQLLGTPCPWLLWCLILRPWDFFFGLCISCHPLNYCSFPGVPPLPTALLTVMSTWVFSSHRDFMVLPTLKPFSLPQTRLAFQLVYSKYTANSTCQKLTFLLSYQKGKKKFTPVLSLLPTVRTYISLASPLPVATRIQAALSLVFCSATLSLCCWPWSFLWLRGALPDLLDSDLSWQARSPHSPQRELSETPSDGVISLLDICQGSPSPMGRSPRPSLWNPPALASIVPIPHPPV